VTLEGLRMRTARRTHGGPARAGLLLGLLLLSTTGIAAVLPPPDAGTTTFSDPTEITNRWFPVSPGAVKVYVGREDGQKITVVETHRKDTRVFTWEGTEVECRVVDRLTFLGGSPIETERRWFAQADDGTVYCFGEAEQDEDEADDVDEVDDPDEDDPGGWVVGQLAAEDPPDAIAGARPTVWMPPEPAPGDAWVLAEFPPAWDERGDARRRGETIRTPAGAFPDCVRIRKESPADGERETTWHAPGAGLVKVTGSGIRLRLQASTLR
jgi:hypothetical protein